MYFLKFQKLIFIKTQIFIKYCFSLNLPSCYSKKTMKGYFLNKESMAQQCPDFPNVRFAELKTDKRPPFNINDKVEFDCKKGYYMRDYSMRMRKQFPFFTCTLKDNVAIWDYDRSACVGVSCGHPGYVENAKLIGNVFAFPHMVTFECDKGFKHTGLKTMYCMPSGVWSPSITGIQCRKITCPNLDQPTNGTITYTDKERSYDSIANYSCNQGFRLVGNNSKTQRICTEAGTWDGSAPFCEKITCVPPDPSFLISPVQNIYQYRDIILFRCPSTGKELTSKCLENGMWSSPICESDKVKLDQPNNTKLDQPNSAETSPTTKQPINIQKNYVVPLKSQTSTFLPYTCIIIMVILVTLGVFLRIKKY